MQLAVATAAALPNIATPSTATILQVAADSAILLLQLAFSPARSSPTPAAPVITTLVPTAYAPAPITPFPTSLVRNFAPMVLIGCCKIGRAHV